jgi:hypothetical protein
MSPKTQYSKSHCNPVGVTGDLVMGRGARRRLIAILRQAYRVLGKRPLTTAGVTHCTCGLDRVS